jgi:hypothetical protein
MLLMAATLIAFLAVMAAWGSDTDEQATFRLESLRPVRAEPRHPKTAA